MKEGFKSVKEIAMYFHSSFRNVGLFASLTFASMAAASKYAKDDIFKYILLLIMSMTLLAISLMLNYFLLSRIVDLANKFDGLNLWIITSVIMFILQITLLIFGIHSIYIKVL